ncbi:hypothetical protein ACEWY4_019028 [Coilia grayii]|uniref:Gypsy retrotransposon integrase-like protein 1 n=1 Tax=Coilia grayii TaxID=363190 RepID=A0ABD1JEX3_9TELE
MSSEQSLEDQVRALTELVNQLTADNQRLRGGERSSTSSDSAQVPSSNVAGVTPVERLVCVPRERKCPRFSGKMSVDNMSVQDWIEEASRSLAARPMPRLEQALFVYDLLDGEAKREIKFSPAADRNDPQKIFEILKQNFSCSKSVNALYRQFYQRRQFESESVREYSHVLMELMEHIQDKDESLDQSDRVLRDQFVEGLRNDKLQGELLDKISANQHLSFRDVRSEALDWLSRRAQTTARPRAYSCNSYEADTNAVTVSTAPEFIELKECLRKQQAQLDAILTQLGQTQAPSSSTYRPLSAQSRPYQFQADGKPICLRCNKAGHIARFCRAIPQGGQTTTQGSVPRGEQTGVNEDSSTTTRLIGNCPVIDISLGGVLTRCLLDTGSMVTTVTESFFRQQVEPQIREKMQSCDWLQLKAANGLAIPYLGYIELDLEVLGKLLPKIGVLVVRDSLDPTTSQQKRGIPGLLGMNAISRCYQELFKEHGQNLFKCPPVQAADVGWRQALSECQSLERLSDSGYLGKAVVQPGPALRVPAGCLKFVPVTCSILGSITSCFLEPLLYGEGRLPSNLLISTALLPVTRGKVNIPVVNVGTEDQWLYPRTTLGSLHVVELTSGRTTAGDPTVFVRTADARTTAPIDLSTLQWSNLSVLEQQVAKELLERYQGVFSEHDGGLGCTSLVQHEIPVMDTVPVRQRYRRLPPSQFAQVKAHVQELVEKGIVQPSSSPYASPIVVVQKKDGTIRLCVDYRQLNAKTRKDAYPLPRIEESLDALTGATLFSTLDLASGYNQVPMAEKDKEKTAFCTPFGLFEFNRMPFGLCNAPSTFQRLMERIFGDQSFTSLLLYLDDIVIFSSSFQEHLQRLELVLSRLKEHNLKLKLSKCHFFKDEVQYLGHVISSRGVATDPDKIQTVLQWKRPLTLTELRSFLGFASYYRRFVAGFAKHAGPLHKLVSAVQGGGKKCSGSNAKLGERWDDKCEQAFQILKQELVTAPVLQYADFSLPFILEIDASHQGLGAVLSQEVNGEKRPIAFASRTLRPSEKNMSNYSSMKLEFVALKWAVTERFREYLLGAQFVVYTDNNPLSHLQTAKLAAVEQRWASQLAVFNFELRYRPGTANRNADALSRQHDPPILPVTAIASGITVPSELQMARESMAPPEASAIISTLDAAPIRLPADLRSLQTKDSVVGGFLTYWRRGRPPNRQKRAQEAEAVLELARQWRRIREQDGILYREIQLPPAQDRVLQLLLPTALHEEVLTSLHDNHGHQGVERTTELIRQRCYWPKMRQDIERWCKACERCTLAKGLIPTSRTYAGHLLAAKPLEIIAIDFTVMEKASDNHENVLIVTDVFSKFTQAYPTVNQRAETVAKVLTEKWFYLYGVPKRIHSDQGRAFEGELLKRLCKLYGIDKSRTTAYHPEGNGQCERFNRTLHNLLRTLHPGKKKRWPQALPHLLFAYNTSVHQSTGHSPYELMFGRKPQLPVDFLLGRATEDPGSTSPEDWVNTHKEYLTAVYADARSRLEAAAAGRERHSVLPPPLLARTRVCRRSHPLGRHKIQDLWDPRVYTVVKCWDENSQVYHITPEDGLGPDLNVHRSELKALPSQELVPCEAPVVIPVRRASEERREPERHDEEEGDAWFHVVPDEQKTSDVSLPCEAGQQATLETPGCRTSECSQDDLACPGSNTSIPLESSQSPEVPGGGDQAGRPRRARAGQHSNPFHLPRSASQHLEGQQHVIQLVSPTPTSYFRPWS